MILLKQLLAISVVFFAFSVMAKSTIAANTSEPIIIGLDADMSAVAAEGGQAIQRGTEIAIHEINQAGGVLNRPLKLITTDHKGNPARGVDNLRELVENNNAVAVLSGVHTPVVLSQLPLIHKLEIPFLVPWAAGTPIIDNGYAPNYVFRLSVRDEYAGEFLLSEIKKTGITDIALLLERTGWGRSNEKSVSQAAQKLDINIHAIEWFHWGIDDFSNTLNRIQKTPTQALVLVANAPEGAVLVQNMANQPKNERLPIYSHWGITGGHFTSIAELKNIQKVDLLFLQTYSFLNPKTRNQTHQNVLSLYRKLFDPAATAENLASPVGIAHAYDLTHLLAQAIQATGSLDTSAIRDSLEQLQPYQGLVKHYQHAFSSTRHEALDRSNYILGSYSKEGFIVPHQRIADENDVE